MVLTYPRLTFWFKKWLRDCKIDTSRFSLHSCRRGDATFLHNADIPAQMIKLLGNWASEAYLRYIDVTLNKRVESMSKYADLLEG